MRALSFYDWQFPMEKETARIEAFSDGVFSIAITLLILEIKIPAAGSGNLSAQLLRQWPSYFAFVFSFAFIGIMWVNHHRLFTQIKRSDNALLFLNLLLLLGVCAVPFPTAVLAQHLGQSDQRAAAILYHGSYFVIAIFYNILWRYASRNLLGKDGDAAAANKISAQYAVAAALSGLHGSGVGKRGSEPAYECCFGGVLRSASTTGGARREAGGVLPLREGRDLYPRRLEDALFLVFGLILALVFALNREQFHFTNKCGVGTDIRALTSVSVGKVRRNEELPF